MAGKGQCTVPLFGPDILQGLCETSVPHTVNEETQCRLLTLLGSVRFGIRLLFLDIKFVMLIVTLFISFCLSYDLIYFLSHADTLFLFCIKTVGGIVVKGTYSG